ncbi:MAG: hypothetical protein CVT85_03855 [Alphaproteobacteria bacterium HGW-Alphaproteobacteria-7]|jgi:hypothetical protein|nr:MAG: hypothetical protein CVT85_03855 [Alphaproteobacteria bacterium HGW-Alphaproteobacteria-7]
MNFDLNAVWSRGMKLVGDNFQLLIIIAGIFLLLPTTAAYLLLPDFQAFADPTADPKIVAERFRELIVPLIGMGGALALFQFAGYGTMIALIGPDRPTVAQALGTGLKIAPSTLVIVILFIVTYLVGAIVIMLPISILSGLAGVPIVALIGFIPVLLFVVWLMARLSMSMPVLVLGGTLNPLTAIKASFRLTRQKQWQIMLFWTVLMIAITVISMLFNLAAGLFAALLSKGTAALLIAGLANGLTGMASGMIICGVAAAMFEQLAGQSPEGLAATFE